MINKPNKGIIYCRVSTHEQAEDGSSLITQEKLCREYAKRQQIEIVAPAFIEEGESAKTTERTKLQEMMKFCKMNKGKVDAVIIYKIDRLSRNSTDYGTLKIFFGTCGVSIVSITEPIEDNPVGRFIENSLANIAQFDNEVRGERSRNGMAEALQQGRYIFKAPFGYQKIPGRGISTITPDDYEKEIIKGIFERIRSGFKSIEDIRNEVNQKLKVDLRKPIIKSHFYKILTNPVYKGYINIEKLGITLKGSFDPIISEDLFNEVQAIYKGRSKKLPKYKKINPAFPLRGTIKHSCGKYMTGSFAKGIYPHYRCTHCKKINLNTEQVEYDFLNYLQMIKLKADFMEMLKVALEVNWETNEKNTARAIENINKQKSLITRKQNMIVDKNLKGIYDDDMTKKLLSDVSIELSELNIEASKYKSPEEDMNELITFSLGFLNNMDEVWKQGDIEIKNQFQKFIFRDGVIYENRKFRTVEKPLSVELNEALSEQHYLNMTLRGIEPRFTD